MGKGTAADAASGRAGAGNNKGNINKNKGKNSNSKNSKPTVSACRSPARGKLTIRSGILHFRDLREPLHIIDEE